MQTDVPGNGEGADRIQYQTDAAHVDLHLVAVMARCVCCLNSVVAREASFSPLARIWVDSIDVEIGSLRRSLASSLEKR
jgi:hypothetical protein